MANWPIVRSQGTMPGTSTGQRSNINFDTGEVEMWQQVGNLAKTGMDVATDLYLKQAEDQYSTATLKSRESEAEFAKSLSENQDETTYQSDLDKHISAQDQLRPKNPLAAKSWDGYMAGRKIALQKATNDAMKDRLTDKFLTKSDLLAADAESTGNLVPLREYVMSGIALGYVNESTGMKFLQKTERTIKYNSWLDYAKIHPKEVLESVSEKDGKYRIGALPEITDPGDAMAIKNIAISAIEEEKRIKELLITTNNKEIARDAIDFSISPRTEWTKISKLDISDEEKISRFEVFNDARSKIVKGLGNPFNTTTDEILRMDMIEKARNKTLTPKEINDAEGRGISTPDADKMRGILEGKDEKIKDFEETAAAKNIVALLKDTIDDVELNQYASQKGIALLRDAISIHPDWTEREKKEEALRIGRQLEREYNDGTLEAGLENVILEPSRKVSGAKMALAIASSMEKPKSRQRITKTATNPKTGKRIGWNGTKWIPIQ